MRRLAVGTAILALAGMALSWAIADDKEIAKEITERLQSEQQAGNLAGFDINLKVAEGQVLLRGRVSTPEQQKLALDIARRVDGVKRVVNDLEIASDKPFDAANPPASDAADLDDTTIAAALAQSLRKLKDSGDLKGFRISFDVTDGKVVMKGNVSSDEQRDLAMQTARNISGIKSVTDELTIRTAVTETSAGQTPTISDSRIAKQIAGELRKQKEHGILKQFNIDLSVENGVVVYEGRVSSAEQLDLALDIARHADGVRDIVNHLAIVQPQPELVAQEEPEAASETESGLSDRGIVNRLVSASKDMLQPRKENETAEYTPTEAEPVGEATNAIYQPEAERAVTPDPVAQDQRIGEELIQKLQLAKQQGGLRGFGIGVHVSDGTVRMAGRVASPEQKQIALDIARRIDGVRLVVDELKITAAPAREPITRDPEAIAREISERLQAEDNKGNLQGCDFEVKVNGGDVWLGGQVATKEQERLALDTARNVPGVERALSALRVAAPEMNLANVGVSTHAIADASPAVAAAALQGPSISNPARLGIPSSASPAPARTAPAANLPPVVPTAELVSFPVAQPMTAEAATANQTPRPLGLARLASYPAAALAAPLVAVRQATGAMPAHLPGPGHAVVPARYDHPNMPGYAWPSYSSYPNYAGVTYPKQYSPTAWPYIGPFYPYPQVPLGWRRVVLKWDDGWWQLNFKSK